MKALKVWTILIAAALVGAGSVVAIGAGAAKARPTSVAVADLEAIVNKLQEKVQIEADMKTRTEALVKEQQDKEKELKVLNDELGILNASNPGYKKKQEELEKKYYDLQGWLSWQKASLQRDSRLLTTQLYNKILAAAEKVAKEGGYDIVLFKEASADFSNVDPKEINNAIRSRKVLYAAPDLDVTTQITNIMNNEFKNNVSPK